MNVIYSIFKQFVFIPFRLKEYQDIANFDVQSFMISNQISYISKEEVEEARNKEEQEYLEAKNKQDICGKEASSTSWKILMFFNDYIIIFKKSYVHNKNLTLTVCLGGIVPTKYDCLILG